jgi:hypothetical protein
MIREVELLWFEGCANHPAARQMLEEVIAELAPGTPIKDVDATDPVVAERVRFPGSPTIRIDGRDIDPTYTDPGDYTRAVGCIEPALACKESLSGGGSPTPWLQTRPRSRPDRRRGARGSRRLTVGGASVHAILATPLLLR